VDKNKLKLGKLETLKPQFYSQSSHPRMLAMILSFALYIFVILLSDSSSSLTCTLFEFSTMGVWCCWL